MPSFFRSLGATSLVLSLASFGPGCSQGSALGNADAAGTTDDGGGSLADLGRAADRDGATLPSNAAFGAAMPQCVDPSNGTAVLAHPSVTAITWDGDANRTDAETLLDEYAKSAAWSAQTTEYGVGPLTVAPPQHLAGPPPKTYRDSALQSLLQKNVSGKSPAWGAYAEGNTYIFFIPDGTVLSDDNGGACCQDFDGYHSSATIGGVEVPYAVACACPGFDGPGTKDLEQLTIAASHELVEMVSDPNLNNPAFGFADDAHAVWTYVTDGELADLCEYADTANWQPADMHYTIQRSYSNAAAAKGHDPCVGDPRSTYYQAIPDQNDDINVSIFGDTVATKGTRVALGASGNLHLTVYADDPAAGPFTVTVDDYSSAQNGGKTLLRFTAPGGEWKPGDTLEVPVTVAGWDAQLGKAAAYMVTTKPVKGGPATYFFAVVGQ